MRAITNTGNTVGADLDAAFNREARIGVLITLAARGLWMALTFYELVENTLRSRAHMPANMRFPLELVIIAVSMSALSVGFYVLALRSKKPLVWCFVSMVYDLLVTSELKLFWLWRPAVVLHAPIFVEVRYLDVIAFLILMSIYILPMSRVLSNWTGALYAAAWSAGIVWMFSLYPDAKFYAGPLGEGLSASQFAAILRPDVLIADLALLQVAAIGLFALVLSFATVESRRFVVARVRAETERGVLARFFPPDVVARIAQSAGSLSPAKRRTSVLFVGVPDTHDRTANVFAQLEAYYALVEERVFAHGGVVDRFDGGPVMAAFGALDDSPESCCKAFACVRDLAERLHGAQMPASISLHTGNAICGDAGGARNRVFSIVGDVVNTSRRILDEARKRSLPLVISDDAARAANAATDAAHLDDLGVVALRGRDTGLRLWSVAG